MTDKLNASIVCIDYRFDYLTTEYFDAIGQRENYFLLSTAGSSLCLGYTDYVNQICNCRYITPKHSCCNNNCTDPNNFDMKLLKESIKKNLDISLGLKDYDTIYMLNHQDCGAFKAYLECSGYPKYLGENNSLEIKINTDILLFAKEYIQNEFPKITNLKLGLIDVNGYVANYNTNFNSWELQYRGPGCDPKGLWYGL